VYVGQWGSYGSGPGEFSGPNGVAVDTSGNVYVADTDNARVQVFTSSGSYLTQFGSGGRGNGQFQIPIGVAVDSSGKVYVGDTYNYRIQVFGLAPPAFEPRAYLPVVFGPSPTPTPNLIPIQNGGFDNGLLDWQSGTSGGFATPTASTLGDNDNSAVLLGNPTYGNPSPNTCNGGVPVGGAWISQTVTIPTGHPTLTFDYDLWTQDNANGIYDSFDVYVNGLDDDAHRLFRNSPLDQGFGCDQPALNFYWQSPPTPIDLSAYAGQTITLDFAVYNRVDGTNNTWVYLDSVAINP
jgi:hypothetical protein